MILLDSNIIIYSAKPENDRLREFIGQNSPMVSSVSVVEVLGYHRLTEEETSLFKEFFSWTKILPISDDVVSKAVKLRREKNMTLGDVLIAATALVNDLTLVTNNTEDFDWIGELRLLNPMEKLA